jgi:hypothetical protein
MSAVYYGKTSESLRELKSKKMLLLEKLRAKPYGYWVLHDIRVLNQQIQWIEAVLASRDAQLSLL